MPKFADKLDRRVNSSMTAGKGLEKLTLWRRFHVPSEITLQRPRPSSTLRSSETILGVGMKPCKFKSGVWGVWVVSCAARGDSGGPLPSTRTQGLTLKDRD